VTTDGSAGLAAASGRASLIPSGLMARIGTEFRRASGRVRRLDFQRWASSVGDLNPLYFDEGYARVHGYRDVIAPPMFLPYVTTGVVLLETMTPDGRRGGSNESDVEIPGFPRRVAGGEDWTFHHPVYDGDEIHSSRVLHDLREKSGRSGVFILTLWDTTYTRLEGAEPTVVAKSMTTIAALS
jgi:acyl dehydratase